MSDMLSVLERSSPTLVGKANQKRSTDAHKLQTRSLAAMKGRGSVVLMDTGVWAGARKPLGCL